MAITHNNSSNAGTSGATSLTWSHTCSGSDRLLIVGVSTPSVNASGVTFNGVALTQLDEGDEATGPIHGEYWYLIAPAAATANIVVTFASSTAAACGASSYTGVHQTTPFGAHKQATGNSNTASVTLTTAEGEWVHDCLALRTGATTITAGAGQTQRWNRMAAASTLPTGAGSSATASPLVTTMQWTVDDATSKKWVHIAAPVRPSETGLKVTIAGTNRTSRVWPGDGSAPEQALRLSLSLGADWTAEFDTFDTTTPAAGAYRTALDDAVYIDRDGTRVFNGTAIAVADQPWGGTNAGARTRVRARANSAVTDQIRISKTYAAGQSLKTVVQDLVTNYLAGYGISLDTGMVSGPTLEQQTFDYATARHALNHLGEISGYVWRITPWDVLEMFSPGTKTAAYSLTDSNGLIYGPELVTWEQTRTKYVNRVHVRYGESSVVTKTHSFTGDGSATSWTLTYPAVLNAAGLIVAWVVVEGGNVYYPLYATIGGVTWSYDAATNALTRSPALPNGTTATFNYQVQFPLVTSVEDAAEIAANDEWADVIEAPEIFDLTEAQALGNAYLRRYKAAPKTVRVVTEAGFEMPGTAITITLADRTVSGTHTITAVEAYDINTGTALRYTLTCIEGTEVQESTLDTYKNLVTGKSQRITGSAGGSASGGVVPNSDGGFDGDVVAHVGGDDTNGYEIALEPTFPASARFGPAVRLGRGDKNYAWEILADVNCGSTPGSVGRLAFRPKRLSGTTYPDAFKFTEPVLGGTGNTSIYLLPGVLHSLYLGDYDGNAGYAGPNENTITGIRTKDLMAVNGLYERARTTRLGEWIDVAHAAGNFTTSGGGAWTVDALDQVEFKYTLIGKTARIAFNIKDTDVAASPGISLQITIPGGLVAADSLNFPLLLSDAGAANVWGYCQVNAGSSVILCRKLDNSNWTVTASDNTSVFGTPEFEVQ